jgi:5-methylcytosine-specific restriction endonuclease McrA
LSGDALGVSINPDPTWKKRAYRYDCEPEIGIVSKNSAASGDMHVRYLYAGGKRAYDEWREAVFKRDGYKCQKCGSSEKLQAHHVKPFINNPHLVVVLDNGITLCEDCHRDVDDIHRKMVT